MGFQGKKRLIKIRKCIRLLSVCGGRDVLKGWRGVVGIALVSCLDTEGSCIIHPARLAVFVPFVRTMTP